MRALALAVVEREREASPSLRAWRRREAVGAAELDRSQLI
jgi:hypothetical protein